eukprot:975449-Pleurochrysis_carterae.AAC.6
MHREEESALAPSTLCASLTAARPPRLNAIDGGGECATDALSEGAEDIMGECAVDGSGDTSGECATDAFGEGAEDIMGECTVDGSVDISGECATDALGECAEDGTAECGVRPLCAAHASGESRTGPSTDMCEAGEQAAAALDAPRLNAPSRPLALALVRRSDDAAKAEAATLSALRIAGSTAPLSAAELQASSEVSDGCAESVVAFATEPAAAGPTSGDASLDSMGAST